MCASLAALMRYTSLSWANTWITWPEGNRQHTLADMNHSGDKSAQYAVWQLRLAIPWFLFVTSCCPLIVCPAATVMPGLNPLKAKRRQRRRLPTSTPCPVHCSAHETDFSLFIFYVSNLLQWLQCILLLHGFLLMDVHCSLFSKVHWLANWLITKWWV